MTLEQFLRIMKKAGEYAVAVAGGTALIISVVALCVFVPPAVVIAVPVGVGLVVGVMKGCSVHRDIQNEGAAHANHHRHHHHRQHHQAATPVHRLELASPLGRRVSMSNESVSVVAASSPSGSPESKADVVVIHLPDVKQARHAAEHKYDFFQQPQTPRRQAANAPVFRLDESPRVRL